MGRRGGRRGTKLEGSRGVGARGVLWLSRPCTSFIPGEPGLPDQLGGTPFLPSPAHSCSGTREHSHPAPQGQAGVCLFTALPSGGLCCRDCISRLGRQAGKAFSSQTSWNLGWD